MDAVISTFEREEYIMKEKIENKHDKLIEQDMCSTTNIHKELKEKSEDGTSKLGNQFPAQKTLDDNEKILPRLLMEIKDSITAKGICKIIKSAIALITLVVTVVCTIRFTLSDFKNGINSLDGRVDSLNEKINSLDNKIDNVEEKLSGSIDTVDDSVSHLRDDMEKLSNRVSKLEGRIESYEVGQASKGLFGNMNCVAVGENSSLISTSDAIIRRDSNEKVTAENLVGKKLLLNYENNGFQNVFYGQFNKNNHWDGECIINSYKNGELDFMADAIYDDGILISYKQVFRKKETKVKVWVVSIRNHDSKANHGESWEYKREKEIKQDFQLSMVALDDVVWPSMFISSKQTPLAYYNGDTNNGEYNDESGDAYLIKYAGDGTISMLYKGFFVNGKPEDTEKGDSWEIIWNGVDAYNYFKGKFHKGAKCSDKFTETKISPARIKELTRDIDFNFAGLWNVGEL